LISIVLDNKFLNNVISFTFLTWIGEERIVAGITCSWFEIVLCTLLDDAGNKSSTIDRATNLFAVMNNIGFLFLCDGEFLVEDDV
jgi:hypothetical protein